MPKVMIEMEMPNGCKECKLYDRESCILDDTLLCEDDNRPRKCPLQKVEECDMDLTKEQIDEIRKEICARTGIPYSVIFSEKKEVKE